MAKVKLHRKDIKKAVGTLNYRANNKDKQVVEHVVLDRVELIAGAQYRHAIQDILSIFSHPKRLASPGKPYLTSTTVRSGLDKIGVAYPKYSKVYSEYLKDIGEDPKTKPYWSLTGDLGKWMESKVLKSKPQYGNVTYQDFGSREKTLEQLEVKKGKPIPLVKVKAKLKFPHFSEAIMRTTIMENYFNAINGKQTLAMMSKPSADPERNRMKIYGEESYRPIIAPLARHHGERAMKDLRKHLAGSTGGKRVRVKK